jgi:hypothetical protein
MNSPDRLYRTISPVNMSSGMAMARTPASVSRREISAPVASGPTRPSQVASPPRRDTPIATLLSAPPTPKEKLRAYARGPMPSAAIKPIDSPNVNSPLMSGRTRRR